jgi:hypothetical protein
MAVPRVPGVKGIYIPTKQQSRIRELLPKGYGIQRGDVPYSPDAIQYIINQNAANPQAYAGAPFMGASRTAPRDAKDMAKRAARREELAAKRKKKSK